MGAGVRDYRRAVESSATTFVHASVVKVHKTLTVA